MQADDLLRPALIESFFLHMNDTARKGSSQCGQLLVVDGHAKVRRRRCNKLVRCLDDAASASCPTGKPLSVYCERTPAAKSKYCKQCTAADAAASAAAAEVLAPSPYVTASGAAPLSSARHGHLDDVNMADALGVCTGESGSDEDGAVDEGVRALWKRM